MTSDLNYIRRSRPIWLVLSAATATFLAERQSAGKWLYTSTGQPRLTDFAAFWAAAKRLLAGEAASIYDGPRQAAYEAFLLHQPVESGLIYPYPPSSLPFIWPLALFPYTVAWLLMLGIGCGCWFVVLSQITRDRVAAFGMTFAFGAAAYCIQLGQNGFFTASLLCGALLALPRMKCVAGILIGLLSFKPQLAGPAFIALIIWREWKALQWSVLTAGAIVLLSIAVFGISIWMDFFVGGAAFTDHFVTNSKTILTFLMQSIFAAVAPRWGFATAFAVQAVVGIAALFCVARIKGQDQRAAGLIAATALVTPFAFLYDLVMLVGAGAMLLRNVRNGFEATGIIVLMALPGVWFLTAGQIGVVSAAGLLVMAFYQSEMRSTGSSRPIPGPQITDGRSRLDSQRILPWRKLERR